MRFAGPAGTGAVLYAGEFLDTPKAEALDRGTDNPAEPIWGRLLLMLENSSWGDSAGDTGQVIWDNVRLRRYPSAEPPPPWRVLDDFSSGSSSNWIIFRLGGRGALVPGNKRRNWCCPARGCPSIKPRAGVFCYREPFEISRTHTLEVEVDLISARAPHRMVSLTLGRYVIRPVECPGSGLHCAWALAGGDLVGRAYPDVGSGESTLRLGINDQGRDPPSGTGIAQVSSWISISARIRTMSLSVEVDETTCPIWDFRTGLEVRGCHGETHGRERRTVQPGQPFPGRELRERLEVDPHHRLASWRTHSCTGAFCCPATLHSQGVSAGGGERRAGPRGLGPRQPAGAFGDVSPPICHPSASFSAPTDATWRPAAVTATVRIWDVVRGEAFGPPLPGALGRFSPDGDPTAGYWRRGRGLAVGPEPDRWTTRCPFRQMRAERTVGFFCRPNSDRRDHGPGDRAEDADRAALAGSSGPVAPRRLQPRRRIPHRRRFGPARLVWDVPHPAPWPGRPDRFATMCHWHTIPSLNFRWSSDRCASCGTWPPCWEDNGPMGREACDRWKKMSGPGFSPI